MNQDRILAALEEIISTKNSVVTAALNSSGAAPVDKQFAFSDLEAILSQQPELNDDQTLRIGEFRVELLRVLPRQLIRLAVRESPEAAVRWLEKLIAANEAVGFQVMPLYGVNIGNPITLTPEVALTPGTNLTPSPQWQELQSEIRFDWKFFPPRTALIGRTSIKPIIFEASDPRPGYNFQRSELLEETRLCLTLVTRDPLIPAMQWLQFEDIDLTEMMAFGRFHREPEIQPADEPPLHEEFDADFALKLIPLYQRIVGEDRARVRRALDRFDRSMKRHDPGDAALELSIALESLLGESGSELTWKVGLRGALLAGGAKSERIQRRTIVTAIYSLRSTVAHTGKTPENVKLRGKGKGRLSVSELALKGREGCADIIAAAIERGTLPDWFEAELGL